MASPDGAAAARVEEFVLSPATKKRNQFRIYASAGGGSRTPAAASSTVSRDSCRDTPSSEAASESASDSDHTVAGRPFLGLRELGSHLAATFQASE
eukprot:3017240-Rhodomonas_salina.1